MNFICDLKRGLEGAVIPQALINDYFENNPLPARGVTHPNRISYVDTHASMA